MNVAITYKEAGVNVEAGYEAVRLMKEHVKKTFNANVLGNLGSFGGFYALNNKDIQEPVLVAGTDGVGTKLKIAFILDKHDTVGQDCVAMCVNDIICQGAQPLFFLDYIATGKTHPPKIADIVKGIADGCLESGCALIGGETAEMPGFYSEDEYDLAGFSVGIVDKSKIINGCNIREKDVLIGLPSSGLHSNGFSLVRKLILRDYDTKHQYDLLQRHEDDFGCTIGEELLKPTRIYVKSVLSLLKNNPIKGIAHITGGGFIENIPRIIPSGLNVKIHLGTWPIPPIFTYLQKLGDIPERSIFNTFNMGIGLILVVDYQDADRLLRDCHEIGEDAYLIGEVGSGKAGVELCHP